MSDAVADLGKAAAGHDLRFFMRVALGGENAPPESIIEAVNAVLTKVSRDLKLE